MKTLKKIFPNSIVIAIMIVHWFVFIFSLFYERHLFYSDVYSPDQILFNWLLYLNTPAIFIVEFINHPVLSLIGRNPLTEILGSVSFAFFSSLQWLFIGHLIARVVEIYKPKEVKLMLK
ncbi:MAG TPA: hypothetical protein VGC97_08385 [Pyrinomonadaceae bacterium]|jgi:uncharacterized membrane protein YraQ (UPF0718 family)